jgi:hypothetical protein
MSNRLCRECKFNYAAICFNRPHDVRLSSAILRYLRHFLHIVCLDVFIFTAYFNLHDIQCEQRLEKTRSEARTPESSRRAQSSSRARSRAVVSLRRLLRCERSHSGQIRDAPPRPRRWRIQGRSRSVVWGVSPDLLSGGGGVRARWITRPHAEAARTERRAQAQLQCDGLHREAHRRRWTSSRSCIGRATRNRTRHLCSPPQHRTRNSAQKKTVNPALAGASPARATVAAYEALRTAVIDGAPRPEGVAALRYHGMLHGLPMLAETAATQSTPAPGHEPVAYPLQADGEFVRLIASLVLHTHSELVHVY